MKKFVVLTMLILSSPAFSQSYNFTQSSGTYTNLSGSTSVIDYQIVPIGFTFKFFNVNYDTIQIRDGGYTFFLPATEKVGVSAFDVDVFTAPATMSYQITGETGSKIFKLEWKDVILNNNLDEFISFQMWLYEGTNCIDIFIGPNGAMPSSSYGSYTGPSIGFGLPESGLSYGLSGDPNNPDFILNNDNELIGTPSNGTIYKFCPSGQTVFDYLSDNFINIFPNPSNGFVTIDFSNLKNDLSNIEICNVNSQMIYKRNLENDCDRIIQVELSIHAKGIYFVKVQTEEGMEVKKLVIQ